MRKLLLSLLILPMMAFGQVETDEIKVIELNEENSVVLRDAVTWASMSRLQYEVLQLSSKLGKNEPIYLVLDTPGGSVSAGEMFIETIKGIPQPVNAIVLYAASMGFQITQSLNNRYIVGSGTLMSHRATIKLGGQLDGELESRLLFYKNAVTSMEERSARRIGINIDEYKYRIINEWWERGIDAVKANVADEVVVVKCADELLKDTIIRRVFSFFGSRQFEFSKCPLITAPVSVARPSGNRLLDTYFNLLYFDKDSFVENYVTTGDFNR